MAASDCDRAYRSDARDERTGEPTVDNVVGGLLVAEDKHNHRELLRAVITVFSSG